MFIFQPTSVVFSWPCLTRKVQRQILPKIRQKRPTTSADKQSSATSIKRPLTTQKWEAPGDTFRPKVALVKETTTGYVLDISHLRRNGEILWITAPFYSKQRQRTLRPCSIAPIKDLYFLKVKKDMLLLSSLTLPTLTRKIKLSSIT